MIIFENVMQEVRVVFRGRVIGWNIQFEQYINNLPVFTDRV